MSTTRYAKIDLAACRANDADPAYVFPLAAGARWLVAAGPAGDGGPCVWADVSDGDAVHVPLYRYFVTRDPADAVAFAAGLGLAAGALPGPAPAAELLVAYASVVEDTRDPGGVPAFAVYLGFAARTR